jgi:hypothetical protein
LPALASPRVHPEAFTLFAHRARTGRTFPTFERNEAFERTGELPVVVRWASAPDSIKRERLAKSGVTFDRNEPIASGGWLVRVTERGLNMLAEDRDITRVSVDMYRRSALPLDRSLEETNANIAKRAAIAKNGERLDGKGIVIADIDSPIFIHHPAFFRADGGAFAWIDVDSDGTLTPGKDGIDLDGSGTIEPAEVLHDLRSTVISRQTGEVIEEHSSFAPETDYLYLDTNGNGRRDYGKGFDEFTPAYGEPLFVFDDVNHDQKTQTSERVLQLKTPKIKAIVSQAKTLTRGKSGTGGLNAYAADRDERLKDELGHATGVAGILVGGQPGISKWIGFAPEADLIVADSEMTRGTVTAVQWALDQKANIILTEYAPYVGVTLDGSSEDETILDAANSQGVVTVSPAGNLAIGRKHRTMMLEPGTTNINLATNVDGRLATIALHYRGAERTLGLSLKLPNGSTIDLPDFAPLGVEQPDGSLVYSMAQTTPRNTHERFVSLVGQDPLPKGKYQLTATLDAGPPLEVDLFAGDDVTAWAGGFAFDQNTPERTICNPATSDKTISVAAYVLHDERPFNPAGNVGEIATYSSRGPLFDGTPGIELAAPDNPLSAAPPADKVAIAWEPFGGTSGAGPHVAGAVALLKEANPNIKPEEIKKRLLDHVKPGAGGENRTGKGKLDIAAALEATIADGAPPNVRIETAGSPTVGSDATLHVSAEDDGDNSSLTARWDLDYDGTFDTEWLPLGEQTVPLTDTPVGTKVSVKVEVRDNQGNINGATTTIEVVPPAATAAPAASSKAADEGCLCRATGGSAASRSQASMSVGVALIFGATLLVRARRRRAVAARRSGQLGTPRDAAVGGLQRGHCPALASEHEPLSVAHRS